MQQMNSMTSDHSRISKHWGSLS